MSEIDEQSNKVTNQSLPTTNNELPNCIKEGNYSYPNDQILEITQRSTNKPVKEDNEKELQQHLKEILSRIKTDKDIKMVMLQT